MKLHYYPPWAMLAWDYYDLEPFYAPRSLIIQPKLNGVRARWHHIEKKFISRDGLVFPKHVIPHLYDTMESCNPSVSVDGELYCHSMAFQTIAGIVNPSRTSAHAMVSAIAYCAFDILSDMTTTNRLIAVDRLRGVIPVYWKFQLCNEDSIRLALKDFNFAGYEGVMLRHPDAPYTPGRTRNLIKVKPLKQTLVRIIGAIEGTGKFKGMLGALRVCLESHDPPLYFKIGGGNISTDDRVNIYKNFDKVMHRLITIAYAETSKEGKPLKAQIVNREEFK